jgi:hypothetical protein
MGIAERQVVPERKIESEPWTVKRLFPFAGAVTTLSKVFTNPFDVLLAYLIFVLGLSELIGHRVSWMMWVFTTLILTAALLERHKAVPLVESKEGKKPKQ